MKTLTRCLGACALALALTATPARAQVPPCIQDWDWGVAPTFVRNADDENKLGGRAHVELCTSGHDLRRREVGGEVRTGRFPFSHHLEMSAYLVGVPSGEAVPFQTSVAARGGLSLSLSGPAPVVECTAEMPDEECERLMAEAGGQAFDWGFLVLTGHGKVEASAGWEERSAVAGGELRYAHRSSWVPSLLLTYDWVKPIASEARDALDPDREPYGRAMLRGYWAVTASRLRLELDVAAYQAHGLTSQLEAAGWDSGTYVSGTVGLDPRWSAGFLTVESIFVQFADGRLPSSARNHRAWSGGIELSRRR